MAFVIFNDGRKQTVEHQRALAMWAIISGEVQGSEQQQAYIRTVKRLYLDWYSAPKSYQEKYPRNANQQSGEVSIPLQYKDDE